MYVKNKTGRGQFSLEIDILYFYILLYGKNPFIRLTLLLHVRSVFFNFQFLDKKIYYEQ